MKTDHHQHLHEQPKAHKSHRGVALIASARTPFLNTATAYSPLMSYELAAYAIQGVMQRCPRAIDDLGLVVMGTVLHEVNTTPQTWLARRC